MNLARFCRVGFVNTDPKQPGGPRKVPQEGGRGGPGTSPGVLASLPACCHLCCSTAGPCLAREAGREAGGARQPPETFLSVPWQLAPSSSQVSPAAEATSLCFVARERLIWEALAAAPVSRGREFPALNALKRGRVCQLLMASSSARLWHLSSAQTSQNPRVAEVGRCRWGHPVRPRRALPIPRGPGMCRVAWRCPGPLLRADLALSNGGVPAGGRFYTS